jgi:DNA-binding NarL/FixJ family response regulator
MWFVNKFGDELQRLGVDIVGHTDNGAEAVGMAVAEQPDLVLVEDTLAMVPGEQVVRELRKYCPDAVLAAQVAYSDRVGALLEAGAAMVFTRQIPPAEIVERVRDRILA